MNHKKITTISKRKSKEKEKKGKNDAIITRRINIPEGVSITFSKMCIVVKGPKGELSKNMPLKGIRAEIAGDEVVISSSSARKKTKAMLGTINAHIKNMIKGVSEGFEYKMKVFSVHFPINVSVKDNEVHIKNFLGEKTLRKAKVHGNVGIKVEKDEIRVSGISREDVGQTCANIEAMTRLSGKDRRIFQDGIYLAEKVRK